MKTKPGIETVDRATGATPWAVFAGTCIQDASGKTIMVACESNEGRGGTFESVRETVSRSVNAVNTHADLLAACEAMLPFFLDTHDEAIKARAAILKAKTT